MKRSDRLFELLQRLRSGQVQTAATLAREFGVSERTIYRDMDRLAASGIPVEGARGYGYKAQPLTTLPPLNLTDAELDALLLALSIMAELGPDDTVDPAISLLTKVAAVLPSHAGGRAHDIDLTGDDFAKAAQGFLHMPRLRKAIAARQKLRVDVAEHSDVIRPLHLDYWGRVWTCIGWSETKDQFETIRVDQIDALAPLPGLFVDEPGKTYKDWRAAQAMDDAPDV